MGEGSARRGQRAPSEGHRRGQPQRRGDRRPASRRCCRSRVAAHACRDLRRIVAPCPAAIARVALLPRFKTLDALSFAFLSGSLALIGEPSPAPGDPKFQHRNCFDRQRASRARCTKHPDAFSAGRPVCHRGGGAPARWRRRCLRRASRLVPGTPERRATQPESARDHPLTRLGAGPSQHRDAAAAVMELAHPSWRTKRFPGTRRLGHGSWPQLGALHPCSRLGALNRVLGPQ
jgi:hypothetical protein